MSKKQKIYLNLVIINIVLLGLLIPPFISAAGETTDPFEATYRITFDGDWTAADHPGVNLPSGAHFSPLVGGVHNSDVTFWAADQVTTATLGIEQMAELGLTDELINEVQAEIDETPPDALATILRAGNIDNTGSATISSVTVNKDFPLITLVSMIAPSHDWFVGVSGESMLDPEGHWRDTVTVNLYPYDAGTEAGTDFSLSPSVSTTDPIASIKGVAPFNNNSLGTLTFTRINYTDLHLNKQVEPVSNVAPQGQVTYTVVLSNNGDMDASGTVLTDTLPAGVVFAHWIEQPSGANGSGNMMTWTGNVSPTGTITFTYAATYTGVANGQTLTNVAEFAHVSGNRGQASASFTAQSGSVLALSKGGPSAAKLNEPITYTLTLLNNGLTPATNVVISDTLPAGANFVSASNGGMLTGAVVEWQPGDLAGNSAMQVSFVVTTAITTTLVNHDYGARADGGLSVSGSNSVSTLVDSSGLNRVYLPVMIK